MKRRAFVAVVLSLTACESLLDPKAGRQTEGAANAPQPEIARLPPAEPPAASPPPAPSTRPAIDPKRLVGLTREQVVALIGPPGKVSDSPPATVWAYQADGCSLDVMFYMDLSSRTFRALAYEVRREPAAKLAERDCLARIRASRNGR